MKRNISATVAATLVLLIGVKFTSAQTFTWQPTSGGLYNTAANWSPAGGPPNAAGEIALFNGTATQTVTLQTNLTVSSHTISSGNITYQLDGTTQTMSGGAGLIVGDTAGTTGRFTILNGTLTGDMALGNGNDSIGFFTIGADALFDAAANGTVIATSAGSSATLTIRDGGRYAGAANMSIANNPTANGSVSVTGLGSSLTTGSGTLIVGSTGEADLTISGAGVASAASIIIADAAAAIGDVTVTGTGSTLSCSSNFTVANSGTATMRLEAGGTLNTSSAARIAFAAVSTGVVTVTGAGSTWNTSSLAVGGQIGANGGTGTLVVENGGAINVTTAMEIRSTAGSAVTIDGGTVKVGGNFTRLGTLNLRDGTLQVTGTFDNGTANTALTIDGGTPTDLPMLQLSGSSGLLSHVTTITVGSVNRGAFVVDTGRNAALGSNNLLIGTTATGNGAVTVTGANSTLSTSGTIAIGGNAAAAQGTGSLTVGPNANVSASGFLLLFPQGTLTIDGGTLNVDKFNANGGHANFTSGAINFTAIDTNLTAGQLDALLGVTHELGPGRKIGGGAGTLAIQSPVILTGGTLASGSGGTLKNSSAIDVRNGGTLTGNFVVNDVNKTIVVSGTGSISAGSAITNNGTLQLDHNIGQIGDSLTSLTNVGTLRGSGVVTSPVTNPGLISVIGGDMEFIGLTVNSANTGLITGRDGTLRFTGTLSNSGSLAFSGGAMDVYGDITQNAGGRITVSGGGVTTFYDDVTIAAGANNVQVSSVGNVQSAVVFLGSYNGGTTGSGAAFIEGDHRPGNSPALVNFGGDVFYGGASDLFIEIGGTAAGSQFDKVNVADQLSVGGTLNVSLINGFAPAAGQSFDILDFAALNGTFNTLNLPALAGGLSWNTSQLYTTGTLSIVGGVPGDYNNNGVVDAADYVLWRNGGPLANEVDAPGVVNAGDYTEWRTRFGNASGAGGGLTISGAAVPEPSTIVALLIALKMGLLPSGRRRSSFASQCESRT